MRLRTLAVLVLFASPLSAQMGRRGGGTSLDPDYWVGLSYGFVDGTTIYDGNTGTQWRFGYSSQIRATLEKTLQRGFSGGISAGFSNAPLTYSGNSLNGFCSFSCSATADITQIMAFVHGGSGIGFHGLYNVEAGFTEFSNFRETTTDTRLDPMNAAYDFSFGLGGGIGYGFSPTTDAYVGEMFDFVLHPQGTTVSSSAPRLMTFRAGFRVGF